MSEDFDLERQMDADMAAYYEEEAREQRCREAVENIVEAHQQRYALAHLCNVFSAAHAYVWAVWQFDGGDMELAFYPPGGMPAAEDHWFVEAMNEGGFEAYVERPWRMDDVGSYGGLEECLSLGHAPGHLTLYRLDPPYSYHCGGESDEWDTDYNSRVIAPRPVAGRKARYRMRRAIKEWRAVRRERLKRNRRLWRARLARPDLLRIRVDYGMDNIYAVLESSAVERADRPALGHKKRRWMPYPTTCQLFRVDAQQNDTDHDGIVAKLRAEAASKYPHWGRAVLNAVPLGKHGR